MKCERHPWHSIDPGNEAPLFVRSIIEIPKGSKFLRPTAMIMTLLIYL